jgi:hypothetical protein
MDCKVCRAPGICICEPAPPAALAGEYKALLADLHELDWGALPAVGRAAATIEAAMEHASKQAQDIVTLGQLAGRAAVLEARVVQLEALLEGRDKFIVDQGLWSKFVAQFPYIPAAKETRAP